MPIQPLTREEHLEQIKHKLKQIQNEENAKKQEILETTLGATLFKDFNEDGGDIDIKDILINVLNKLKEKSKEIQIS